MCNMTRLTEILDRKSQQPMQRWKFGKRADYELVKNIAEPQGVKDKEKTM